MTINLSCCQQFLTNNLHNLGNTSFYNITNNKFEKESATMDMSDLHDLNSENND